MKKVTKRFMAVLAATLMITVMCASSAFAAVNTPKSIVVYANEKMGEYGSWVSFRVDGGKIIRSSVKSSAKWLKPINIQYSTFSYVTEMFDGTKEPLQNDKNSMIGFNAQKAGTASVSYKIGTKSYTTKVTVKDYVNPAKTVNIANLKYNGSTNLAGATKNAGYIPEPLKIPATKTAQKVKIVANTGWKIADVYFSDDTNGNSCSKSFRKGVSSVELPIGKIVKGNDYYVSCGFENTNNGATIYLCYRFI